MPDQPIIPETPKPSESEAVSVPVELPKKLTPEEQMALYEDHLKESDWGHQPC